MDENKIKKGFYCYEDSKVCGQEPGTWSPTGATCRMPSWAVGVTVPGPFLLERPLGPPVFPLPSPGPFMMGM